MKSTKVVLIGDADIRMQARLALEGARGVEIVGELAACEPRHLRFVEELAPEAVVLDGAAAGINPPRVLASLRAGRARPRVIVAGVSDRDQARLLTALGASGVVTTREALRAEVCRTVRPVAPVDPVPAHGLVAA